MAQFFDIRIPDSELADLRAQLSDKDFRSAVYQIVSRGTRAVSTAIKKEIRLATSFSRDYLSAGVKSRIANGEIPTGRVTVSGRRLPLMAYKPRAGRRGVRFTIAGRDFFLRHGFMATMASGHVGIFSRTRHLSGSTQTRIGKDGRPYVTRAKLTSRGFAGRLAIAEETGPSLMDLMLMNDGAVEKKVNVDIDAILRKLLAGQRARFLSVGTVAE